MITQTREGHSLTSETTQLLKPRKHALRVSKQSGIGEDSKEGAGTWSHIGGLCGLGNVPKPNPCTASFFQGILESFGGVSVQLGHCAVEPVAGSRLSLRLNTGLSSRPSQSPLFGLSIQDRLKAAVQAMYVFRFPARVMRNADQNPVSARLADNLAVGSGGFGLWHNDVVQQFLSSSA